MTRSTGNGIFQTIFGSLVADSGHRRNWRAWTGFCAILVFAWLCYQPAITAPFQFDDDFNLRGLATIEDTSSALEFIFTGIAGPTGRPLALASFALQAGQWELGASAFLRVNILIHLVNALLVALFLYQLSLQRGVDRDNSALIAVMAASLWVLMPLLATASLLVVQRMTTLSALVMLLGLNGYLLARSKIRGKPDLALVGMTASLVGGTILSGLSKESGFLLPVFVLVLEATVLRPPGGANPRKWRIWRSIFLVLPFVLLMAYLLTWLDYSQATLSSRGINVWERLLTETRVLWIYLYKALVGNSSQLGVYQSPPTVSRSLIEPATLLASLAWSALVLTSIMWRRRFPLFAFCVLWYLTGHLIESSVVPLELYFEHRNYMPIIGPLFAICCFVVLEPNPLRRRIAGSLVMILAIVNAWFLYSFANLTGQPSLAARYWAHSYPESPRAVLLMANYRLQEEGPVPALQTIDAFVTAYPQHAYMRIPELNLRCKIAPNKDHGQVIENLERELPTVDYTNIATWTLTELLRTTEETTCNGVDYATVGLLAKRLHSNPRYRNQPAYNVFYYKTLAYIALKKGEFEAAIEHLQRASNYGQSSDVNVMMVTALTSAGKFDAARDFVDDAIAAAPMHPVKAAMWRRDLDNLRGYIRNLEKKSKNVLNEPNGMEPETERL